MFILFLFLPCLLLFSFLFSVFSFFLSFFPFYLRVGWPLSYVDPRSIIHFVTTNNNHVLSSTSKKWDGSLSLFVHQNDSFFIPDLSCSSCHKGDRRRHSLESVFWIYLNASVKRECLSGGQKNNHSQILRPIKTWHIFWNILLLSGHPAHFCG